MDHLLWQRYDEQRPRVPYMCQQLIEEDICGDLDQFCTWPERNGWTLDSSVQQTILASHCQSWLFFGMIRILTELRGTSFSLASYISQIDCTVLGTYQLRELLGQKRIDYTRPQIGTAVDAAQQWLLDMLTWYEEATELVGDGDEETFHVLWATAMLLETLEKRCNPNKAMRSKDVYDSPATCGQTIARRICRTSVIINRLKRCGRCPTLFRQQNLTLEEAWTVLAISMVSKEIEINQTGTHQACPTRRCNANNTTSTKQHASDCLHSTRCVLKGVDSRITSDLIRQGTIPLVRSIFDGTTISIEIVDRGARHDFVAISHVWAGGLGNPEANSMYECQLVNIHVATSSTRKVPSTTYYWLDTLCVPVQDDPLKTAAIDEMARIYASAKMVLVLDITLQHIEVSNLTSRQIATIIAVSPWMTRSWTFQEATIAKALSFQFRDKIIRFSEVEKGLLKNSQLQAMWSRDFELMEGNMNAIPSAPQRLLAIWRELSHRESTKVDDIAAIIAVFIDRSAGEVLGLDPQDRVYALLRSQTLLPTCMLFAPCDTDVVAWKPKLPTLRNSLSMPHSVSFLKFTEDNLLELSELQDLYMLRSQQAMQSSGTIVVEEEVSLVSFMITFFDLNQDVKGKGKAGSTLPEMTCTLFVFPKELVNQQKQSQGLQAGCGLCFVVSPHSDNTEKATFHRRFLWTMVPSTDIADHVSSVDAPSNRSGQTTKYSVVEFPPPWRSTHARCQLLLDMGIPNWKPLSWSRQRQFQFAHFSLQCIRYIRMLELVFTVIATVFVGSAILLVYSLLFIGFITWVARPPREGEEHVTNWTETRSLFIDLAIPGAAMLLLCVVRYLEVYVIRKTFRQQMQKTWAISFSKLHENSTMQSAALIRGILLSPLILCLQTFWVVAMAMLTPVYAAAIEQKATEYQPKVDRLISRVLSMLAHIFWPPSSTGDDDSIGRRIAHTTFVVYLWCCLETILRTAVASSMLFSPSMHRSVAAQQSQHVRQVDINANQSGTSNRRGDEGDVRNSYLKIMAFLFGFVILVLVDLEIGWMFFALGGEAENVGQVLGLLAAMLLPFLCGIGSFAGTCVCAYQAVRRGRQLIVLSATDFPDRNLAYAD